MPERQAENGNVYCEAAETTAALAAGRLHGALEYAPDPVLRIFAARILRETLMSALRREGHAFTDQRFHAWFAGLVTLSETQDRQAIQPKVLCEAILTELTHSRWLQLKDIATRIMPALLAPQDLDVADAHTRVHTIIAESRRLTEDLGSPVSQSPFASLGRLHSKVLDSVRFAPPERRLPAASPSFRLLPADQPPTPALWAIELHCDEYLSAGDWLRPALPLMGLIRRDSLDESVPQLARNKRARALRETVEGLHQKFGEALRLSLFAQQRLSGQRSTSRAPALLELLAGFGPLRSAQMEKVMGATRLGVRGMITTLESQQLIERRTIVGSHLYSASPSSGFNSAGSAETGELAFSSEALDDFDASIARLDELLAGGSENDA